MAAGSPPELILLAEEDMETAQFRPFAGGRAGFFSTACPGRPGPNEDAVALAILDPSSGVLAVADGVGGLPGGRHASQVALRELLKAVSAAEAGDEGSLRGAILDGFENANRAVMDLGTGSATTLAVVEIQGGTVRPYHVGDSLILVAGQRGKLKLQSVSHSPVGYAVESGLLDEQAAMVHEDRHLVSNILGSPDMRIEIGSALALDARDTVVLASDGLSDNLDPSEIVARTRKGPLEEALAALRRDSLLRMAQPAEGRPSKPDDLTVAVFRRN